MAIRKIVKIDEDKCNGCGLCVSACAEGAIQLIDGKAKLVSDVYCDGLGACLGECPQGAISIEEREAADFDLKAAEEHVDRMKTRSARPASGHPSTCPGSMARTMQTRQPVSDASDDMPSALSNWPVQLNLVPANAPYLDGADILLAADCVPFAYPEFHRKLLVGKTLIIGCPKLDDASHYVDKLADILRRNDVRSLTIARMEVPCCSGLTRIAQAAVVLSGKDVPVSEMIFSIHGERIQ